MEENVSNGRDPFRWFPVSLSSAMVCTALHKTSHGISLITVKGYTSNHDGIHGSNWKLTQANDIFK